jgi:MoaA/NifB/PqqE/SkfB family radical SAM enzyme
MDDATVDRSLYWVERLGVNDVLALHVFGEPLLHPEFDAIAGRFNQLAPITMSTNGVLLDEKWADRLAKLTWNWISVSPWDKVAQGRAIKLLDERGICTMEPSGVLHDWAGQAKGPKIKTGSGCSFLAQGKAVIRWNGEVASCCISDREEDAVGHVVSDPEDVKLRGYSICEGCHQFQG